MIDRNCFSKIVKIFKTDNKLYPYDAQIWVSLDNKKTFSYSGNGRFCKTYKEAMEYKKQVESLSVDVGTVVHSNDKYFYGSDGFSKNRESAVVAKNGKKVALAKLTTSENEKYEYVPNYNNKSKYMTQDLYTKDDKGNNIYVSQTYKIDDCNKFVKSSFPSITEESAQEILKVLLNDKKYGKRNRKRLEEFLKKREY